MGISICTDAATNTLSFLTDTVATRALLTQIAEREPRAHH